MQNLFVQHLTLNDAVEAIIQRIIHKSECVKFAVPGQHIEQRGLSRGKNTLKWRKIGTMRTRTYTHTVDVVATITTYLLPRLYFLPKIPYTESSALYLSAKSLSKQKVQQTQIGAPCCC